MVQGQLEHVEFTTVFPYVIMNKGYVGLFSWIFLE